MNLKQAITVLDSTIPPSNNKMVDMEHLPIAQAWETIKESLSGKWVKVEERLPEKNRTVLCYCESRAGEGYAFTIGSQDHGCWFLQTAASRLSFPQMQWDVIYWMELPLAPEVKK